MQDSSVHLVYVGERNGHFQALLADSAIDETRQVLAGKYRRYHGESWLARLTDIKTIALNVRDGFYFIGGFIQALRILRQVRPDVVFLKGGFVGVPIGLAAALYRIPIMTHDSDATAGLANRLVSRWTSLHATAFPPDQYPYPQEKTKETGVIVSNKYEKVDEAKKRRYRRHISIPDDALLLLVTGGSTGAQSINDAMQEVAPRLLQQYNDLYIVHQAGKGKAVGYGAFSHDRLQIHEFLPELHIYSGAADVIIMRAGANTLAEFGVQAKPCIVVPSPHLSGGHQLANADWLAKKEAIRLVAQSTLKARSDTLHDAIVELLDYPDMRRKLARNIHKLSSSTQASSTIAQSLVQLAKHKKTGQL